MDTLIYLAWVAAVPLTYLALVEIIDRANKWNIERRKR